MKKLSMPKILGEILDVIESGRKPSPELLKQGRAALKSRAKSVKAATAAAATSGRSGRQAEYDREAIKAEIRKDPKRPTQELADKFGCSMSLISILRREVREEK